MRVQVTRRVAIFGALLGSYAVAQLVPFSTNDGPQAFAADEQVVLHLPISKTISKKELEKYKSITVTVDEDGKKAEYRGVPLRTILAEMVPSIDLNLMPSVKALARQELVLEARGFDDYPGIVTALEVAINKSGDRYILATHKDGHEIDPGVQLICKMDEARTRWVHRVVKLNLVPIEKSGPSTGQQLPTGDFGSNRFTFDSDNGLQKHRR